MLWDPKWQEKVTPEVKPMEAWRVKYLAAADDLERHGWVRGTLGAQGGARCVMGALLGANVSNPEAMPLLRYLLGDSRARAHYGYLAIWNDDRGRTKEHVTFALRDCAMNGE